MCKKTVPFVLSSIDILPDLTGLSLEQLAQEIIHWYIIFTQYKTSVYEGTLFLNSGENLLEDKLFSNRVS